MSKRTAVIIGSTGAIGRQFMPLLVASALRKIIVLHHRATIAASPRSKNGSWISPVSRDLGQARTSRRCSAASAPRRRRPVERGLPKDRSRYSHRPGAVGRGQRRQDVHRCQLGGCPSAARSVYLRTKGEMESGVAGSGCPQPISCVRRSWRGDATSIGWRSGSPTACSPSSVPDGRRLRKYRAVHTKTVARAMLACASRRRLGCISSSPMPSRSSAAKVGAAPMRTICRLSLTIGRNARPASPRKESNFKHPRDTVQPFPLSSSRLAVGGQASVRRSARK